MREALSENEIRGFKISEVMFWVMARSQVGPRRVGNEGGVWERPTCMLKLSKVTVGFAVEDEGCPGVRFQGMETGDLEACRCLR